jgi:putative membrane protein
MLRTYLSAALVLSLAGFIGAATQDVEKKGDRDFVKMVAENSLTEIKLGQLAQDHSASETIKKYGQRVMADHTKMNKELAEIAKSLNMPLPEKLNKKHQDWFDMLSKVKGKDFDRAYVKDMIAEHEKAITKYEMEAKSSKNLEVKAWAEKWLPTVREHLKLAQVAAKEVSP